MNDEGRRCALPGCSVEIQPVIGRPERRYCCAAHRAAARRARRAATQVQRTETPDLAATLPWLHEAAAPPPAAPPPDPGDLFRSDPGLDRIGRPTGPVLRPALHAVEAAEPGAVVRAAARRSRDARQAETRPRRRRALAVLGVAGILAGGYAVTVRPDAASPSMPVQAAPDGDTADAWARRATVALAAVNRQLDTLAQTEEQWKQMPASRNGVVPAPVTALEERRSLLEQRRTTLAAQLDAYRALRETQQDLADSEQHLQAVEEALVDMPPAPRRSAAQDAVVTALDEQRDLRIRRRDAQRTEVDSLSGGVDTAARTPIPDDSAATAEVSDDVLDVIRDGGHAPRRPDDTPSRPDVVGGREQDDGTPRQDPGTSGPPDPRGPRDESEERRDGATRRQAVPDAPTADVLGQLHERAREVARQARRAEASRTAAPTDPSGTGRPRAPGAPSPVPRTTGTPSPVPRPSTTPAPGASMSAAPTPSPGPRSGAPTRHGTPAPRRPGQGPGRSEHGTTTGARPRAGPGEVEPPGAHGPARPADPSAPGGTGSGPGPDGSSVTRRGSSIDAPHPTADRRGGAHRADPGASTPDAPPITVYVVPGGGAVDVPSGRHARERQDDDAIEEQNASRSRDAPPS